MEGELSRWIAEEIRSYISNSPENMLGGEFHEKAWETVLVGFSSGDDPYYTFFKEDIGDFYFTPHELFIKTFPDTNVTPQELSVISWVLPQTEATKRMQRADQTVPCERAVRARTAGDEFNKKIGVHIIQLLKDNGYAAVCPMISPYFEYKTSEKYGYASNWSERHAAFASGLGTFGLSDALITPVGMAMRCGSIIANAKIMPTKRPYTHHNEYCLFYKTGGCMACAKRCPAGAITEKGHDKTMCQRYRKNDAGKYSKEQFGIDVLYCGICQYDVPCESRIP